MKHDIADQDWIDYLDGRLAPARRDALESHLIGCWACWEFYQQMARTTARLEEWGAEVRQGLPLRDGQLHAGLRGVFARLREAETTPAAHDAIRERLDYLATVIAPMCGAETAIKALQVAAQGSPARSLERVTRDNWTPFLTSLTSIATVMCGETGAHLVWESGQL
jgi:anti-sigma factor RsiW